MASVLRYPYEAITKTTDYLQIVIANYTEEGGESLIGRNRTNVISSRVGAVPKTALSKSSLKQSGDTILLPMPSNIQDGNSVKYADDSLNGYVAGALSATQDVITGVDPNDWMGSITGVTNRIYEYIKGSPGSGGLDEQVRPLIVKALAAQAVSIFGGNVTVDQLLARETGNIFNPNMELLFNGVTLRSFKFSFKMTPRSENEAKQVKLIIRSLKQNMAPKTVGALNANFLKTPNIFELEYKKGNDSHPFLHKFKQCALTDMNVNYTGENIYATYPQGEPISVIMDLTFRELSPIYDSDYTDSDTTVGY
jgi:hypothetical protein